MPMIHLLFSRLKTERLVMSIDHFKTSSVQEHLPYKLELGIQTANALDHVTPLPSQAFTFVLFTFLLVSIGQLC